ncbi:AAA family ATPase [Nocardia sp. NPDC052001]|uniref:MinD/ParA family ATP-binding protein n=1 Tax=Nocardia sp. NPDC052001 TaxID=3154853 RepID=UPI003432C851
MNRAPSSSGETTGSVRARGGYDAYFGAQEQTDTGSTWRSTVAGRSHQPPPPPGRALPPDPEPAESPDTPNGSTPKPNAAGPDPASRAPGAAGDPAHGAEFGPSLGGEPASAHGGTPHRTSGGESASGYSIAPQRGSEGESASGHGGAQQRTSGGQSATGYGNAAQQTSGAESSSGYGSLVGQGGGASPAFTPPVTPPGFDMHSAATPSGAAPASPSASGTGASAAAPSMAGGGVTFSTAPTAPATSNSSALPHASSAASASATLPAGSAAAHSAQAHAPSAGSGRAEFGSAPALQHANRQAAPPATRTAPQGGYQALPISLTSNELLADIAASRQAQLRSSTGMRGALNKVGFNLGLSPTELRTEDRHARIRRQLGTAYQVAVLNVKGGVGRTTTVAALGATFAALRPDRVAAIDANPDFGDLAARTSRHPFGLTLRDLAQERHLDAFSAVQSFASITNSDLAVVASPWSPAAMESLTGSEYLAATETLRKHYNLLMVDCGTGVLGSAASAVLESSDSVVLVTPATVRGVTGAVATLEWLNAHGQYRLAANSVIAIVLQHPSKPVVEVARIEELFATAQRPTFVIPYDAHLAEGGEIDLRLLDKETALAFEELAATVADGFPDSMMAGYGRTERGGRQ